MIALKILLIDDHALFREGLTYVLEKLDPDVHVVEAPGYERAIEELQSHADLGLVLLDLNLRGKDGFDVLRECVEQFPQFPVAVISGTKKPSDMKRVLDMGAAGFIPKDTTGDVMLSALKVILAGGYYVPKALLQNAKTELKLGDPLYLTARQAEVVALICEGMTNKQIATRLGVAEATIKMHVTSILSSLKVSNRTQIAKVAQEQGLV